MVSRQQFLSHAAAVVVGQQVHGLRDLQMDKQCLLQVCLLHQAVSVIDGLVRITKAEHVASDHPETLAQRAPQVVPVPTGGGETV
ncbi:Uncharacterised protein [Pseudomonas putida]|nr:Uncharacterised protein [Pseudomonas putida]